MDNGELAALTSFYGTTHNEPAPYTSGMRGYPTFAANNAANMVSNVAATGSVKGNLEWLNAYNAPHLVNVRNALPVPSGRFADTDPGSPGNQREAFASSWVYDTLQAWRDVQNRLAATLGADQTALLVPRLSISSLTAPNRTGGAPHAAGGHSLNMAVDLTISDFISPDNQNRTDLNNAQAPNMVGTGWSVANAISWTGLLNANNNALGSYNLRAAARYLLSLYALTVRDNVPNTGDWSEIQIANGINDAAHTNDSNYGDKLQIKSALFGDGQQANSLIQHLWFGMAGRNTYPQVNAVLRRLGIAVAPSGGNHHTHFHVDFRPAGGPVAIETSRRIESSATASNNPQAMGTDVAINLQGEDMQRILSATALALAFAGSTDAAARFSTIEPSQVNAKNIGSCEMYDPNDPYNIHNGAGARSLRPIGAIYAYVQSYQKAYLRELKPTDYSVKYVEQPRYGVIESVSSEGGTKDLYVPNAGYSGNDRYVAEVTIKGVKFRVAGYIRPSSDVMTDYNTLCRRLGLPSAAWKISDATGNDIGDIPLSMPASLAAALADLDVQMADLTGPAVATTTGEGGDAAITLDTDAAGHGWFIDPTPGSNEEFLPTADPNVWQAKPGSAAEGKMDMLSVLLHEYGHALGLDHTADAHDFMAATLSPGMRRTLSAEDQLMLMRLTGYVPVPDSPSDPFSPFLGAPLVFGLGRLRGSMLGALTPTLSPGERGSKVQYEVAPNPTLTNPEFAGNAGWNSTGTVTFGNGAAVLTESATAQTRLNQLFVVSDHDRFLRFTLSDIALDDVNAAPDDAFEVALIDANTGASLLGSTGLTRTDALLNLQANGTEHLSPQVTSTLNADGSRTYLVDLSGVAAGTVASLSFDLIGFGRGAAATSSHVTVRDLKLGIPETHDDAATAAEDTPAMIAALANDLDADQPGFVPVIVSGPAHGQVLVNADGTFGYTPDRDWFGDDSFSYKLSDGRVDSNSATVRISVTPVNDAPVTTGMQLATLEDTPVVIDLLAQASDVDSATLAAHIVDAPAHGMLTANVDGTYTYTPNADFNGADSFTYRVNDGELESNLATVTLTVASVNDAPQGRSTTVSTLEDTPYVFQLGDFGFTDANDTPANGFAAVIVGSLPQAGSLLLNGQSVAAGQSIAAADIAAGALVFAPAINANGSAYAAFTFQVQDDGGTADGGVDRDPNERTITIDVTSVNDAPQGLSTTVTTLEDTPYVFQVVDFGFADTADVPANAFVAVVIDSVPVAGSLMLNGAAVSAGQSVAVADIAAGLLAFAPATNENGTAYASFTFRVQDDGGTADGGVDRDPVSRTLTIDVTPVNDAPVAADAQVTTLEDQALVLDLRNNASDVDNAVTTLTGRIIAGPLHGALALNADGTFTYTPNADFNGTDGFTYQMNDGALDSNVAAVTVTVTSVNDAPQGADATITTLEDTPYVFQVGDFGFSDVNDAPANNFAAVIVDSLPQAGSLTLNGQAVAAGQSISVADIAAGALVFMPAPNANGPAYASFTFRVQDDGGTANGGIDRDPLPRTLMIDVTPVNDAPVAADGFVTGQEDTPYTFTWADFNISDIDGPTLSIIVNALPLDGLLQYFDGINWSAVAIGQSITQADIDAGNLCFGPEANASGFDGYGTAGAGNLKRDYARFAYQAFDGELLSAQATMTVDILPVADLPTLALVSPPDSYGAVAELLRTSWESAPNRNRNFTILPVATLEDWRVVKETELGDDYHPDRDHDGDYDNEDACERGQEAFIIWSSGDRMKDANRRNQTVYAAPGNGNNWLELGDAQGEGHQTYGIERTIETRAGVTYDLSFDYAGHLGYGVDYTRIGVYVDGVQIGTYANTSPNTALNWQAVSFSFEGTGLAQTVRFMIEGTASESNGRGAMLDNIRLNEQLPLNTGYQDSAIRLAAIAATLQDPDGSETLSLAIGAIPVGATLTDGTNSFTATATAASVDVTHWSLSTLSITPPTGFTGSFDLAVIARATEAATHGTVAQTLPLTVTVVPSNVTSPIVLDLNGDGIKTLGLDQTDGTFDLLNTGTAIHSGWLSGEDGFLALDTNGNGIIDTRNELFGGAIGEGFAKLKALDGNHDGRVDAQDKAYTELKVWQDKNGNHQTDAGELYTLSDLNIRSLNVGYTIKPEQQNGNWLLERAQATRTDGTRIAMADAYFEIPPERKVSKREEEREAGARITVQSKPAQPKVPDLPFGPSPVLFNWPTPAAARTEDARKPLIGWAPWTAEDSEEGAASTLKKRYHRPQSWLDDFLGVKGAQGHDLAKATGLTVRVEPRAGSEPA